MQQATVRLDKIDDSPFNPRQDFADVEELAASIREMGVLQRPIVRPSKTTGRYELVAGHHRKRAAIAAGLSTIDVDVGDFTDEQSREMQIVENTQRSDLSPLEEAEGYQALLDLRAQTVAALAERVGKPPSHVRQRLQLLRLVPEAREALRVGDVSLTVAGYLARIPHDDLQIEALKQVGRDHFGETCGAHRAKSVIERRYMLTLGDSCFKPSDPDLPGGPCGECPKRTGASPDLFGDVDGKDVCADPKCHAAKVAVHTQRELDAHRAKGLPVLDAEESKGIFPAHNPRRPSVGYVRAEEKPYDPSFSDQLNGRRKWKTVLGKHTPPPVMAVDGTGAPVLLLEQKALRKARKAAGLIKPAATKGAKKGKAKGGDAQRDGELSDRVTLAMYKALPHAIKSNPARAARRVATIIDGICCPDEPTEDLIADAFGVDRIAEVLVDGSVEQCLALAIILDIFGSMDDPIEKLSPLLDDLGVDVAELRNNVEQDMARERVPADPRVEQETAEAADGEPDLVMRLGIKREEGWLYFVDKDVNVARTKMVKAGQRKTKKSRSCEVIAKTNIRERENGWLYFLDDRGNLSRRPFPASDQATKRKVA